MTIVIRLPWLTPPLRSNDRLHWAAKAKRTREIRETTTVHTRLWMRSSAGQAEVWPMPGPVTVELVWTVKDKRRRDADGPYPTLKACLDGLVDAGLILDDRVEIVPWSRPRIETGEIPGVRLEIRDA